VEAASRRFELVALTPPEVWYFRDGWQLARTLERATYDQLLRRLSVVVHGSPPKDHNSVWNAITITHEDAVYCFAAEIFAVPHALRAVIEVVPSVAALRERAEANQLQPRVPAQLPLPGWGSRSPYR
ncbi:MAG: hypothetical protein H0V17_35990, partial [Deltaproteobacteria bacterium]|nr:hypothetical protein [Deltaproteobacteria bacterium]